jgi:hypothetical protein
MKTATVGRMNEVWRLPFDRLERVDFLIDTERGFKQALSIGVTGRSEEVKDVILFQETACIHDINPIAVFCDKAKIVGNEEQGTSQLSPDLS